MEDNRVEERQDGGWQGGGVAGVKEWRGGEVAR